MRQFSLILGCLVFLTGTAASGSPSSLEGAKAHAHKSCADHKHGPTAHHFGYVKPGAAIALKHNYDGQSLTGELESFSVTLSHLYSDGNLTVELLPTADLNISSNITSPNIPLHPGSDFTFQVQMSSLKQGEYRLGVSTVYEAKDGHQVRRISSIPIQIGNYESKKPEAQGLQASKFQSENTAPVRSKLKRIIALPAQETIR